jgi:hypothetical protein
MPAGKGAANVAPKPAAKRAAAPKPTAKAPATDVKSLVKPSAKGATVAGKLRARKAQAPAPVSPHVAITEVGSGQCRFIVDARRVPALCCGLPAAGGSWCSQHLAIVYTPSALRTVRDRERAAPAPRI